MLTVKDKSDTKRLPMMPIRDVVIFPHMMTPFVVGRESSVRALEEAMTGDRKIFLATQHDASTDEPRPNEIFHVGCIASIVQSLKLPDGNIKVLVEGVERAKLVSVADDEGFFRAVVRTFSFKVDQGPQLEALTGRVTSLFEQYVKLSQNLNYETMVAAIRVDDPGKLADTVGANLQLTIEEKQELLEIFDPVDRLTRVAEMLDIETEKLGVDRTIQGRVKRQMEKAQKEYYLNEKIKAIQKELGRGEKSEFDELKKRIEMSGMTKDAAEKAMAELKRLENMPPMSAESTVSRNYLDWLLAVPWKKKSKEIRELKFAEQVLESDHYGLEKIKERILEFLAVRRMVKNPKGSILLFVGPPGVGKTSLGMSIVLQNVAFIAFGASPTSFKNTFPRGSVMVLGTPVLYIQLFLISVTVASLVALMLWINRTRTGIAMRCVAQDPLAAGLVGIDSNRMVILAFAVGSAMAGMAGWLFGMYYGRAVFYMGLIPGLKAFTACVIGGMGSIPGAMVGSIIMGELEVLSGAYVSLDYKDAFSLGALFIILILRPNGLFGGRDVARRV